MAHRAVVAGRRLRQARERKEREGKDTSAISTEKNIKSKILKKKAAGKDSYPYRGSKAANEWAKFAADSPSFNRKPIKRLGKLK